MNRQFTSLRGLAIAIVVLHHCIRQWTIAVDQMGYAEVSGFGSFILSRLLQLGIFAVPAFLFISGCFFAYAAQGINPNLSYRTVWSSLKHIFWPYLLWSIVYYIVTFLGQGKAFSLWEYLGKLFVGSPFHFVPLLAFFYLLSPVLVRLNRRFDWIILVVIGLYQVFLYNIAKPGALGFNFPEAAQWLRLPVLADRIAIWGIFFPLGLIYNLNARSLAPRLSRLKWLFGFLAAAFIIILNLDLFNVLHFPLAEIIAPIFFVLTLPSIKRDSIPFVRQLEEIGRKSYGLYLTNMIVLFLILQLIKAVFPQLLNYQIATLPFLFALTLGIPMTLMNILKRMSVRQVYPYVFG